MKKQYQFQKAKTTDDKKFLMSKFTINFASTNKTLQVFLTENLFSQLLKIKTENNFPTNFG